MYNLIEVISSWTEQKLWSILKYFFRLFYIYSCGNECSFDLWEWVKALLLIIQIFVLSYCPPYHKQIETYFRVDNVISGYQYLAPPSIIVLLYRGCKFLLVEETAVLEKITDLAKVTDSFQLEKYCKYWNLIQLV